MKTFNFYKLNILQPVGSLLGSYQTFSFFKTIDNDIKYLSNYNHNCNNNFIFSKNYTIYNKIVIVSSIFFGWYFPKTIIFLTALDYSEIDFFKVYNQNSNTN
jgi:hypothetical protein